MAAEVGGGGAQELFDERGIIAYRRSVAQVAHYRHEVADAQDTRRVESIRRPHDQARISVASRLCFGRINGQVHDWLAAIRNHA